MSGKERSKDDGRGGGGGGRGGAGDDEGDGPENPKEKKCPGCGKKPRRFSLFRLRKRRRRGISVNSGCWWRWAGCACVKQPRTLDSSGESPTSDPNSSEFTFDKLRALIEKNDFYSNDCNPHLDGST